MTTKCAGCTKALKAGQGYSADFTKPDGTKITIKICATCKKVLQEPG